MTRSGAIVWLTLRALGALALAAAVYFSLRAHGVAEGLATITGVPLALVAAVLLVSRRGRRSQKSARLIDRRHFDARLVSELMRAQQCGMPLAFLMIELDDRDEAIERAESAIASTCRGRDVAARISQSELAVLAPGTRSSEGLALARRIRDALAAQRGHAAAGWRISIGVTDSEESGAVTPAELVAAAVRAVHEARSRPGERVRRATPLSLTTTLPAGVLPLSRTQRGGHRDELAR